jgi:AraC family transcriptional regulator, regulatory protein of adaptative response / methylated-DNA-[protein]-cysteine methyltransferase
MIANEVLTRQQLADDYQLVERALAYLENHYQEQPSLEQIAAQVGLSEYYFQRVFTRWVGISPKRFLQFLTKEHARQMLDHSSSVLDATYRSGLSSPGRLHDLFVTMDAVTPGEYKLHGSGLTISYGFHPSPFGECLLALTGRGICGLSFVTGGDRQDPLDDLRRRWLQAELQEDPDQTSPWVEKIFPVAQELSQEPLRLYLNGTNFQIKVWEALLRIPAGNLVTYQEIAAYVGDPNASRAVGHAIGSNPIAFVIPCHRVIRKMGVFGGYHWGTARKKAILGWEMARV